MTGMACGIDAVHVCTPNAHHFLMASLALNAGRHVVCEKPLALTSSEAAALVVRANERSLRNCTCYNLRCYPMVQQMRRMREAGELGEVLIVQGTYSQDWLLHESDWNWRVERQHAGPLRAMGDIGSHWCDMAEHVTGLRISELCADLTTFHHTRRRPIESAETFAASRVGRAVDVPVDTEDFGAVLLRFGKQARGAFTVSQVSAGCKNHLSLEVYGAKGSARLNQERPDELWIGRRDGGNQVLLKDPALLAPAAAAFADLPGGHGEGYNDTFKQLFRRFYQSILDRATTVDYPQFADGLRQMYLLDAVLESHQGQAWAAVKAD